MRRNLPGLAGHLKGEGVSEATKPSYICARCQQTFKWYKGVKVIGRGIALCPEHNPNHQRDKELLAEPVEELAVPAPEEIPPCNTTK